MRRFRVAFAPDPTVRIRRVDRLSFGDLQGVAVMGVSGAAALPIGALPSLKQLRMAPRQRAFLEALLDAASTRFEVELGNTLTEFEQNLFKLPGSPGVDGQNPHYAAIRELRRGRADVIPRFLLRLEAGLALAIQGQPPASLSGRVLSRADELALLKEQELDEQLALKEIAARAEMRWPQPIHALGLRFGVLAGTPLLDPVDLPIGPQQLCECLRYAVVALEIDATHRAILYRIFDRLSVPRLGELYEELEALAQQHRLLPHATQASVRSRRAVAGGEPRGAVENRAAVPAAAAAAPATTVPAETAAVGAPQSVRAVPPAARPVAGNETVGALSGWPMPTLRPYEPDHGGPGDDLALLTGMRQLLAERRRQQGQALPDQTLYSAARSEDVLAVLASMQARPAAPLMIGGRLMHRSIAQVKQDLLNQLRPLSLDGRPPRLSDQDGDVLELVSLLFDHLAQSWRPESSLQHALARLQVPMLRVALKDHRFITERNHPARQFLNGLAETCSIWFDDDVEDDSLVGKLQLVVDQAVSDYRDEPELFGRLLTEFGQHVGSLAKKADVAERRHVEAARGRERLDVARREANRTIADVLAEGPCSALARTLLEQAWADVLALSLMRGSAEDAGYQRRLRIARLVRERLGDAAGGGGALGREPDAAQLRQDLETGLAQVGYHAEEVVTLSRHLFDLGLPFAVDPRSEADLTQRLKEHSRLGETTAPTAAVEVEFCTTITELPEAQRGWAERLVALPFGVWFEFSGERGIKVRRKLVWYSTITGHAILVNQRGAKTLEIRLDALAADLAAGRAVLLEAYKESLIDRIWSRVVSTLRSWVGKDEAQGTEP